MSLCASQMSMCDACDEFLPLFEKWEQEVNRADGDGGLEP
jgi:hypothetical protein